MAKLGISTGIVPDDGLGDNLLDGAVKINNNFDDIYTYFGDGTNLTFTGGGVSSQWVTTGAGIHTLSNVGIGTTNPRFALEVGAVGASGTSLWVNGNARVTGILTVGSASITLNGATNIINVGTGITINGSTGIISATSIVLGGTTLTGAVVTSITAGSGISVDQSTGNVTITATGGGGGSSQWVSTAAGIHTLSNVGIGTTNPTSALTVTGSGTSTSQLFVTGISTFGDQINFGSSALLYTQPDTFISNNYIGGKIKLSAPSGVEIRSQGVGGDVVAYFANNPGQIGYVELYYDNSKKFETLGAGVTVTGTTFTNQLSVSGVSTLTSNVSVGGTISIDGGVQLVTNNPTIVGTSGTVGEIKRIGGAPFFYDGSAWREFILSSGTPVSVPADTEWDNVILRSTYDTTSPDFFDFKFSEQPILTGTGATTVASPVKIGTRSFRNNGVVGAGISYAYRAEHDFTGPWTIEFWINHDARPYASTLYPEAMVSQISLSDTNNNWSFGLRDGGSSDIKFTWNNEASTEKVLHTVSYSTFDNNFISKWNHYALVRESSNGSLHFYINGYEVGITTNNSIIDNDITSTNGAGLHIGGIFVDTINSIAYGSQSSIDAHFDDLRITTDERYVSVGNTTTLVVGIATTTTALPTTGTLSSYVQPPGDKYGEIGLGTSPTWRGTSGVTVSQQSSGNYRVSFASTYTNSNDYFVLSQGMDQGFASYVGVARSTTHVDFAINRQSNDTAVDTGALAVQIKNHI